ncbi:MAG: CoA transferase [Alphaproteobacteria bacterium]|nr:CoA transferase [Alphaproteobacteria bacterium]
MSEILKGLRVVEGSAFIAAPSAGMTLAQMGADVIRFDPVGGGLDYRRWPVHENGTSFYWAGLNKGKRSIAIDLGNPQGRELASALVTAPGEGAGLFLTNFPARGWLDYGALKAKRDDLVMVNVQGNPDGSSEVDYTVNCATGLPYLTGHADDDRPVNHVLPAWDLITGQSAVNGLLAAERHRTLTGEGQYLSVALSDVAFWTMGTLGLIAEKEVGGVDRAATGNDLFGAFGRDFETAEGRRVMIVAITGRQWRALVEVIGLEQEVAEIEARTGLDLAREGDRYRATAELAALISPWCGARMLAEITEAFEGTGVCWGPYRSIAQMLAEDPRCSAENPMFEQVDQPGIGPTLTPGAPIAFEAAPRTSVRQAPRLGEHTDAVLAEVLGLDSGAIGALHDSGVVGGPESGEK